MTIDVSKSNPLAVMVRIASKKPDAYKWQRNHDLRKGHQPSYVDKSRIEENETIIEPPEPKLLREVCVARRSVRSTKRAMKSGTCTAFVGIIGFGVDAQTLFEALPRDQQRAAYLEVAEAIADRLKTTVVGLVIHRDESAPHAHLTFPGYDIDGRPLTETVKLGMLSDIQTIAAEVMGRHAPGIERGRRKVERLAAGATWSETINRSVQELHRDLPIEIAAKEAQLADASGRVDEMRDRVLKLEAKGQLTAKEVKRLETYRKRLEDRLTVLEAAQADAERLTQEAQHAASAALLERDEAIADKVHAETQRATALRERDDARADQAAATAKAIRITDALNVLAQEITGETIGRDNAGRVIANDVDGLRKGFPDLKAAVLASADAMSARKRYQAEAVEDRKNAAAALDEAREVRAEMVHLRDVMRKTVSVLRVVLKAVGKYMKPQERKTAEAVAEKAENLISSEKPSEESRGGFSM